MLFTNFRDLGGLTGTDGKTIKNKMILRAGQPVALTDSDLSFLNNDYQVANVVDFRSDHEVVNDPVDERLTAKYFHIDIAGKQMQQNGHEGEKGGVPSLEAMLKMMTNGAGEKFLAKAYHGFAVAPESIAGYRKFIDVLLENDGSTLFHCAAGKDRTGWGAVILLKMLGVSEEDILIDYLATNEGRKNDNERMLAEYKEKGVPEEQLNELAVVFGVQKSFLDASFAAINQEFGSFENYIKNGLNVTEEEIARLRAKYLV